MQWDVDKMKDVKDVGASSCSVGAAIRPPARTERAVTFCPVAGSVDALWTKLR